jgi:hypothetical protein
MDNDSNEGTKIDEVKRFGAYETHLIEIDARERYKAIGIATLFMTLITGGILFEQFQNEQIWDKGWLALIYIILYIAFVGYKLRHTHERVLTKEGMIAKAQDVAAKAHAHHLRQNRSDEKWEARTKPYREIAGFAFVRYTAGVILVILAVQMATSESRDSIVLAVVFFGGAFWLMREAVLWIVGLGILAGIGSLFFGAIAALPVSVAIIIGAWIIASSSRK